MFNVIYSLTMTGDPNQDHTICIQDDEDDDDDDNVIQNKQSPACMKSVVFSPLIFLPIIWFSYSLNWNIYLNLYIQ